MEQMKKALRSSTPAPFYDALLIFKEQRFGTASLIAVNHKVPKLTAFSDWGKA